MIVSHPRILIVMAPGRHSVLLLLMVLLLLHLLRREPVIETPVPLLTTLPTIHAGGMPWWGSQW